jgi:rod shape-determining protein MreD
MSASSWSRLAFLLLVGLVAQVALMDQIVILGAHPDLLVCFPAAAGLVGGPDRGATVGFASGIVADLVVRLPFGLSALCFTLLGFAVGLVLSIPGGRDLHGVRIATVGAACALGTISYALLGAVVHQPGMLGSALAPAVLISTTAGLVFAAPMLVALSWALGQSSRSGAIPSGGSALS